jgi:hypothetical protein
MHHERVSRRSTRSCGFALAVICVACSSNHATVSAPTRASAGSRTTTAAASTTATTPEPSASSQSKSLCATVTARLAGATASSPAGAFQGHRVVFANRDLTAELLTAHDAFYEQLSPLDRQILAISNAPIGKVALDARLNASALDWTPSEIQQLRTSLTQADQAATASHVTFRLPETIYLAKESAAIYSGSPYTRCSAVFLPGPQPAGVLIHELYHVMSRYNPQIRAALYALVGYRPCRVSLSSVGADLKDIVITNPDTDAFGETCITLPDAVGKPVRYVPLIIGNGPYDGTPEGWTTILDPILVALHDNRPVVINGKTTYRELISPDYMRAVGSNGRGEPFHPEELIAVNLQQALIPNAQASPNFPNAELLRAVKAKLASL